MNGYCISGQPPVLMPPPSGNPGWDAWVARCAEARARKAADDAEHAALVLHVNGCGPTAIKAPTRAERIAALQQVMVRADRELQALDNVQTTGRWTQAEFARKCMSSRAARAEARALLADMGVAL
jgi:hypothetical protein